MKQNIISPCEIVQVQPLIEALESQKQVMDLSLRPPGLKDKFQNSKGDTEKKTQIPKQSKTEPLFPHL